jgi:hypothetical protein
MNQEEEYEDDYEDEEYEDDFDDFDGELEAPKTAASTPKNSSSDMFDSSHSVLQGTKSSPRKEFSGEKKSSDSSSAHSAWYGVDGADSSLLEDAEGCGSSAEDDVGCVAPEPMPMPAHHYKAPPPTVVDSGHFTSKQKKGDIHGSVWASDRVPSTVDSARGSAALLPYHTQNIRRGHWRLGKKIGAGRYLVIRCAFLKKSC